MSKVKNIIAGVLLSGVLLGSLTACTSGEASASKNAGNKFSSACDVKLSGKEITKLGDAVPSKTIKDEYGEYCKLSLNTKTENVKFDVSKMDAASFGLYGFTEDDAEQAQESALRWIVEQHLDSTRLDNYNVSSMEWFDDFSGLFFDGVSDVVKEKGLVDTGIIVTDVFPSSLNRDGKPRANSITVTVAKIEAGVSEGSTTPLLKVLVKAEASYPATDQFIIDTGIANNETAGSIDELESYSPELFDGKDESGIIINADYLVLFEKEDMEKFVGFRSSWEMTTFEGKLIME